MLLRMCRKQDRAGKNVEQRGSHVSEAGRVFQRHPESRHGVRTLSSHTSLLDMGCPGEGAQLGRGRSLGQRAYPGERLGSEPSAGNRFWVVVGTRAPELKGRPWGALRYMCPTKLHV